MVLKVHLVHLLKVLQTFPKLLCQQEESLSQKKCRPPQSVLFQLYFICVVSDDMVLKFGVWIATCNNLLISADYMSTSTLTPIC